MKLPLGAVRPFRVTMGDWVVARSLWEALAGLPLSHQVGFAVAMVVAFGFEFINGFHDTANAVTTVIYTRTLRPTSAVLYSGVLNFLGVLLGGTVVAFSIVNLLPVDLLIHSASVRAIVMVVSLMLAGVIWNLATWWYGLPVSSSHTLIGSILGVGLANSLLTRGDVQGVNWSKAGEVGLSLLISPILGFVSAAGLLLAMKRWIREPRLYRPPDQGDSPPHWVRGVLLATCGGVSFAHGSNDGQKGMGLILLALIGFLPTHYALNFEDPAGAKSVREAAIAIREILREQEPEALTPAIRSDLDAMIADLEGKTRFDGVPPADRWEVRQSIYRLARDIHREHLSRPVREAIASHADQFHKAIEYAPTWVVVGVALALGIGTMVGYKRIVVTVAEKIGKAHMTYAQGAAAELVAAATIGLADVIRMPVSTTHVLSSGVAGTMWANRSGIQRETVRKIGLAWVLTLPAAILLSAALFSAAGFFIPAVRPHSMTGLRGTSPSRIIAAPRASWRSRVDSSDRVPRSGAPVFSFANRPDAWDDERPKALLCTRGQTLEVLLMPLSIRPFTLVTTMATALGMVGATTEAMAQAPVVPPRTGRSETIRLFDGQTLNGWAGHFKYWSVDNGEIVGKNTTPVPVSTYLLTQKNYTDFRLTGKVKLVQSEMHSGIAFWGRVASEQGDPATYAGHLVMFPSGWGMYDLFGRKLLPVDPKPAKRVGKQHDWNDLEILALGNRVQVAVNGVAVVDWRDPEPDRIKAGPIGLQLHSNTVPQEVRFKDLVIETFPREQRLITLR